ncbi:hypothetical protein EJ08DRAFT_592726, partial [Tothia fuscella]
PNSITIAEVQNEFSINAISPLIALQESVKGFQTLNNAMASKTFILTGNVLHLAVKPPMLTYGMTKGASAHMIHNASVTYVEQGVK